MKVRNGFVSNSSSSSFIISSDPDKDLVLKVVVDESEYETITTKEELQKHEFFEYDTPEELLENKNYIKCINELESGKVIRILNISSDDGSILSGFHYCGLDKSNLSGSNKLISSNEY